MILDSLSTQISFRSPKAESQLVFESESIRTNPTRVSIGIVARTSTSNLVLKYCHAILWGAVIS